MAQKLDELHESKFANFTDLKRTDWKTDFDDLKEFSDEYIDKLQSFELWPADYIWPKNSLQTNTRVWEYPYACKALRQHGLHGGALLDIGSALTFFPSYLSNKGYDVYATDIDARMIKWHKQIVDNQEFIRANPKFGKLKSYDLEDVTKLSYPDNTFDAVTNISVLEHLPYEALKTAIKQIHRVLKAGGILVCTLDVHIDGERNQHHSPLNQQELVDFMELLAQHFQFVENFSPVVPADLITNIKYPREYSVAKKERPTTFMDRLRNIKRATLNDSSKMEIPLEWGAFGFTLKKMS